jgi:hypothetical protein
MEWNSDAKENPGVYILFENGYLFPPPSLGNLYFFPKKQRDFRATLPTTK